MAVQLALTARILFGLAVMWTIGAFIDVFTGYANPAGTAVFAVVSGVLSLLAFGAARRQRR